MYFRSPNKPPLIPSNLLYAVWNHSNFIAGYEQKDAHEFLIALLDGVTVHLEKYHGDVHHISNGTSKRTKLLTSENDAVISTDSSNGKDSLYDFRGIMNEVSAFKIIYYYYYSSKKPICLFLGFLWSPLF